MVASARVKSRPSRRGIEGPGEDPVAGRSLGGDAACYSTGASGRVPERPKGAVCKIAGYAYGGSNPPPPTQTDSPTHPPTPLTTTTEFAYVPVGRTARSSGS